MGLKCQIHSTIGPSFAQWHKFASTQTEILDPIGHTIKKTCSPPLQQRDFAGFPQLRVFEDRNIAFCTTILLIGPIRSSDNLAVGPDIDIPAMASP